MVAVSLIAGAVEFLSLLAGTPLAQVIISSGSNRQFYPYDREILTDSGGRVRIPPGFHEKTHARKLPYSFRLDVRLRGDLCQVPPLYFQPKPVLPARPCTCGIRFPADRLAGKYPGSNAALQLAGQPDVPRFPDRYPILSLLCSPAGHLPVQLVRH